MDQQPSNTTANPPQLPAIRLDKASSLLSLQSCSINLDRACNFHESQIQDAYRRAWLASGPPHCRARADTVPPLVHSDRLGFLSTAE